MQDANTQLNFFLPAVVKITKEKVRHYDNARRFDAAKQTRENISGSRQKRQRPQHTMDQIRSLVHCEVYGTCR